MDLLSNGYGVIMESVDNRGWAGLRENTPLSFLSTVVIADLAEDNGGT